MTAIRQRAVLVAALLHVLAKSKDGMRVADAYDEIDRSFEFPEEWYRQLPVGKGYKELERLGYSDWRTIAQEELIELVRTEPQWQNEIRWARNDLRKLHYLDVSAPKGIWKLTAAGHAAAADDVPGTLSPEEKEIATPRVKRQKGKAPVTRPKLAPPGSGTREELLAKLQLLVHGMPLGDLQMLVDIARVVKLRSLASADAAEAE